MLLFPGKRPKNLKGGEAETTNNRMEIQAAISALKALPGPHQVELYTDSQYLRRGINEWLEGWQRKGWRTAQNTPVKNQDLWQELAAELGRHEVSWYWTKGHAGNKFNERADRLASSAIPPPELPLNDPAAVHLFTAASYSGKSKQGSWAVLLRHGDNEKTLSGLVHQTTANRMHIYAAVAGLQALKRPVLVYLYTTSDYLKDGATSWVSGWKARNWRTKEGRKVSHRDLWETLTQLTNHHDVNWHSVPRDHAPDELNQAKKLATETLHATNGETD